VSATVSCPVHRDLRTYPEDLRRDFALTTPWKGCGVVAVFGIITTFLVLIRSGSGPGPAPGIGASGGKFWHVLVESGLAAAEFRLGAPAVRCCRMLIFVINKQAFGWTIQLHFTRHLLADLILVLS